MSVLRYKIGDIVNVDRTICDTGLVKIWGYDNSDAHPTGLGNWDYVVNCYDPDGNKTYGSSFHMKESELLERFIILT